MTLKATAIPDLATQPQISATGFEPIYKRSTVDCFPISYAELAHGEGFEPIGIQKDTSVD